MDKPLEALGLSEKLTELLRAAGLETVEAVVAEQEANEGSLEHLDGIGPAYDEDIAEAIAALQTAAEEVDEEPEPEPEPEVDEEEVDEEEVDEEPVDEEVDEEEVDEEVDEEPVDEEVDEEPVDEEVAEEVEAVSIPIPAELAEKCETLSQLHAMQFQLLAATDRAKQLEAENLLLRATCVRLQQMVDVDLPELKTVAIADETASPDPAGRGPRLTVELVREFQRQPVGKQLAVLRLAPGVSLNLLVDAVRNGLAGEREV